MYRYANFNLHVQLQGQAAFTLTFSKFSARQPLLFFGQLSNFLNFSVYFLLCLDLSRDIDKETGSYINCVKTWAPEERVEALKRIDRAFAKSREFNDDKVQLAMQTYEMVRRLDLWLQNLNAH